MATYAVLVSVMHIIDDLEHHARPPISLNKNQVNRLTQKITFLQKFLESYNPNLDYTAEADPLETRIADAAYAAEDVIETHIVDRITNDEEKMSSDALYEAVEKVIEEMTLIEKEVMEIKLETLGVQHQLLTKSTPPDSSKSSSSIAEKRSMVGADDVLYQLKDKLTSHCHDLQIIPVVGMGGAGKTTLALNIYQDRLINRIFYICAWVTISQEYNIREILTQILRQLNEVVSHNLRMSVLSEKLHQHLYNRKFLIVLDDMWSIDAWEGVMNYFPNNKNGSRIIITTRLSKLATRLSNSNGNILEMKLLDDDDSWELLSKTLFGEKDCPIELEEIGKKIGKSCKGLPLSIVVVGGLLAKSAHTREFWEYIKENLNSIVNLEDDERCLKILHMSYKQLPVYLKPCFLYMGVHHEDEVILISKLIKLFVGEGFLKPVSGKSLEEIAKEYLEDLIGRNLILVHELGSTGNIKACKIHDLLRDLCLREAEKERFYTVVSRPQSPQGIGNAAQRRIVISRTTSKNDAINALSSMSLTRSLMWDKSKDLPLLDSKLLRVLNSPRFGSPADAEFLENVQQLVNSRFLAFSAPSKFLFPCSIGLFWNLQTLIIDGLYEVTMSIDFWNMPHIRHVQFDWISAIDFGSKCRGFDSHCGRPNNFSHQLQSHVQFEDLELLDPPNDQDDDIVLENLQTLGRIVNFKCNEQVVKRIPNIKRLKIIYLEKHDDDNYCLSNLDCLDKLEFLSCISHQEIDGSGPDYLLRQINFPDALKKLTLEIDQSRCWQNILDKIGSLPLLQKLKLKRGTFEEGQWETVEGQFHNLKILSVSCCADLKLWTTESSHFPCLEHLLLDEVDELEEIPLEFADISTLRVIDVTCCSDSVVVSAKRIVEEQEDLYGEEAAVQVQVTLWEKDEELESLASTNFRVKI